MSMLVVTEGAPQVESSPVQLHLPPVKGRGVYRGGGGERSSQFHGGQVLEMPVLLPPGSVGSNNRKSVIATEGGSNSFTGVPKDPLAGATSGDSSPSRGRRGVSKTRDPVARRLLSPARVEGEEDNVSVHSAQSVASGRTFLKTGSAQPSATASKVLSLLEARHTTVLSTLEKQSAQFNSKTKLLENGMASLVKVCMQ
jgi:hypothetical protein